MSSEIVFIGTASGIPVADRSHASFLIRADNGSYLFDAGDGCCSSLRRSGIDLDRIGAVFVSHMHPDHCAGLPMLLQMMYLDGRRTPLDIYLPGEGLRGLTAWLEATYLFPEKIPFHLTLSPVGDGLFFQDNSIHVASCKNRHLNGYRELVAAAYPDNTMESYSLAITIRNRRIVYSGDIASLDELDAIVGDADLLIIETTHVIIEEALLFAASKNLDRIVFTHIPPTMAQTGQLVEELRSKHGFGLLALAFDGMKISL